MKITLLTVILIYSLSGIAQTMDVIIEEQPPYYKEQSINLKFYIKNNTDTSIVYFDSRGPSWESFEEEWVLRIDNKFSEILPLNGKFTDYYTDSTFITLNPNDEKIIRTKKLDLKRVGSYTLIYKQKQSPELITKKYGDSTVHDSLIKKVTSFEISKTIKFEVSKSYDTTIHALHNMTWEEWKEYRNVKLYSRKKHFDNMYAALKYPEDVYSLNLTGTCIDTETLKRIGELKNLRALSLRNFTVDIFPKEITELELFELTIIPQKDVVVLFPNGMSRDTSIRELTIRYYGGGVPQSVLNLDRLKYLDISNSPINVLPDLSSLKSLTELVANNTKLTNISNCGLSQLNNLKKLNLSGNKKLTSLSPILGCTNLEFLTINRTSISEIPDEIENLSKLKRIAISNSVTHVSDSIGNLIDMRYLSLGGNRKLDSIPSSILKLKKLLHFDISNTNISILPEGISELPLEHVKIYNTDCQKTKDYRILKKRLGATFKE